MTLHESTFAYLKPTDRQMDTMQGVRDDFRRLTSSLQQALPDGPDKTYVIRLIRTAAMWSHVAITRQPDGSPRDDLSA